MKELARVQREWELWEGRGVMDHDSIGKPRSCQNILSGGKGEFVGMNQNRSRAISVEEDLVRGR